MNKFKVTWFILLCISLVAINVSKANDQSCVDMWNEFGIPLFHNYTAKKYGGHFQNWCILKDNRGIILVANNDGLLTYHRVSWRRFDLGGKQYHSLRSIAQDSSGTIYSGIGNHFGYLSYNEQGNFKFNSVLDKVGEKYRNFNDVWYTFVIDNAVYFLTHDFLFCWKNKQLSVTETSNPDNIFHTAFVVNNTLYVRQSKLGLMKMNGEILDIIPGGEIFADKPVYFMETFDDKSILIGTARDGFYLFHYSFYPCI